MASSSSAHPAPVPTVPETVHAERPVKFNEIEFKRWQQMMLFYLTMRNLVQFLKEEAPKVAENKADQQNINTLDAWSHSNFLCCNYILNGLDDNLYNIYAGVETAKKLWDSLEKKYKTTPLM